MENELTEKKVWQTPEIVDPAVDKTGKTKFLR